MYLNVKVIQTEKILVFLIRVETWLLLIYQFNKFEHNIYSFTWYLEDGLYKLVLNIPVIMT